MAFKYLDEEIIKKLITSLIQSKLEYTVVIWSPHKKDIKKLGRIQRAARKMAQAWEIYHMKKDLLGWNSQLLRKEEKGETF